MLRTRSAQAQVRHATTGAVKIKGLGVPFNSWERIHDSRGDFMERFLAGSFKESLKKWWPKLLFQHGSDPTVAQKLIGEFTRIWESAQGLEFEGELLDTPFLDVIAEGIRTGGYGVSVGFQVWRQDLKRNPPPSSYNPDGLPEVSIIEAQLFEMSVCTWPAYATKVGVRTVPSWYLPDYPKYPRGQEPWRLPDVTRTPRRDYLGEGLEPVVRDRRGRRDYLAPSEYERGEEPWRLGPRPKPSWYLGDDWPREKKPSWRDR